MSKQTLFSRRQILALFGGGTGAAIVGVDAQSTGEAADGNLLGGGDNMPAPFQVGEKTYKGPLSVRSEVPQEDGVTFIQTDAGSANDQFSIYLYNAGWGKQGLNTPSLATDELSGVHRFIVEDSQELADALTYAEQNIGVSIKMADNTVFYPGDHISLPVEPLGGFWIEGHHPGRDSWNYDGILINDAANPSGSIIDCGGSSLFGTITDTTGFFMENFGVRNVTHVVRCGQPIGSGDTKGISYGHASGIVVEEPSDYAFKLFNILTFNMSNIVGTHCDKLAHAVSSHNTLQAGNSVWKDIFTGTLPDTAPTGPGIYLEGRDTALNYMTLISPQVISGSATGTHAALKVEGNGSGAPAQNFEITDIDTEGNYKYGVHETGSARHNHYQYAGNAGKSDYEVYLDGAGSTAESNSKYYRAWSGTGNNWFTGRWKTVDGSAQSGIYRHADEFVNNDERLRLVPGLLNRRIMFFEEGTQIRSQIASAGDGLSPGSPRSPPTASEIDAVGGGPVLYVSDGTVGNFNDIYAAWNISGTVKVVEVGDVGSATAV